jgi:hypothetical protein
MPALTLASLIMAMKALRISASVYEKIQVFKGKPGKADRERLIKYTRRLDERRVFVATFDEEQGGACVGSLDEVRRFTDEALAELEHPGARAVLGGILDSIRLFLDRWGGPRLRFRPWMLHHGDPGQDEFSRFFEDLGELRGKVAGLIELLAMWEPKAVAPKLAGGGDVHAGMVRGNHDPHDAGEDGQDG